MFLRISHSFDTQVILAPSPLLSLPPVTTTCNGCYHGDSPCRQVGGSLRAAEIHWVHIKEGTEAELLVVGALFDVSEYGTNVEVCVAIASLYHIRVWYVVVCTSSPRARTLYDEQSLRKQLAPFLSRDGFCST